MLASGPGAPPPSLGDCAGVSISAEATPGAGLGCSSIASGGCFLTLSTLQYWQGAPKLASWAHTGKLGC